MGVWSPSVAGPSGAPWLNDWFWLLEGRSVEWIIAAALCLAITARLASLALRRR